MGYKITATIKNKKSAMTPEDVNLVSFGFRKNENEMLEYLPKLVMAAMESLRGKYKGLRQKSPLSQKPLTLSWLPPSDENRYLFPNLHGMPLNIKLKIEDIDNANFFWKFEFDDVVLRPKVNDLKAIADTKRMDARMDGLFVKFVDDGEKT